VAGGDVTLRTLASWWRTLESSATVVARYQRSLDGVRLWNAVQLQGWARFTNFSSVWVALGLRQSYFDDRETGDGTALQHRGRAGVLVSWSSDPRRRLILSFWAQAWGLPGGYYGDSWAQVLVRPLPRLELDIQPSIVLTDGEPRFLSDNSTGHYVLGQLCARSVGVTVRASYSFTPRLTLQTYAQPFVAANHYHDFSTFNAGRTGPGAVISLDGLVAGPAMVLITIASRPLSTSTSCCAGNTTLDRRCSWSIHAHRALRWPRSRRGWTFNPYCALIRQWTSSC